MTQRSNSDSLIRPTLLFRALNYCRSKMPSFRKLKTLSDFESSDWEDSSLTDEGNTPRRNQKGEGKKRRDSGRKGRKKGEIDEEGDRKCKQVDKMEQPVPKVCLFKKVSPRPSHCEDCRQKSVEEEAPSECELRVQIYDQGEAADLIPSGFHKTQDSLEITRVRYKTSGLFPESCKKCDSGVLVNDEVIESEIGKTKFHARFFTQTPATKIIVDPLNMDLKYSKLKKKSQGKIRFIDPTNIHEIDLWTDSEEEQTFLGREAGHLYSGGDAGGDVVRTELPEDRAPCGGPTPRGLFTPNHARVCHGSTLSSDSDSVKICLREDSLNSSSESDCQYYYRPFRSPESLRPENTDGYLKRASGKLNLKRHKYCATYSVETDSSNDNFLSVKPSRRVCSERKKSKTLGGFRTKNFKSGRKADDAK